MFNRLKNNSTEKPGHQLDRKNLGMLIALIVVTLVVFTVYRVLLKYPYFEIVLIVYMILAAGFVFAYVIYNRGFSRKHLTPEMLPDAWSDEEKQEFIESGKRRMQRSRWILIPIFAFVFTFAADIIELFVLPFFTDLFSK